MMNNQSPLPLDEIRREYNANSRGIPTHHFYAWVRLFELEYEKCPRPDSYWVSVFKDCFSTQKGFYVESIRLDDNLAKIPIGQTVYLRGLPDNHFLEGVPLTIDGYREERDEANTMARTGRFFYSFLEAPNLFWPDNNLSVVYPSGGMRKTRPLPSVQADKTKGENNHGR